MKKRVMFSAGAGDKPCLRGPRHPRRQLGALTPCVLSPQALVTEWEGPHRGQRRRDPLQEDEERSYIKARARRTWGLDSSPRRSPCWLLRPEPPAHIHRTEATGRPPNVSPHTSPTPAQGFPHTSQRSTQKKPRIENIDLSGPSI